MDIINQQPNAPDNPRFQPFLGIRNPAINRHDDIYNHTDNGTLRQKNRIIDECFPTKSILAVSNAAK